MKQLTEIHHNSIPMYLRSLNSVMASGLTGYEISLYECHQTHLKQSYLQRKLVLLVLENFPF